MEWGMHLADVTDMINVKGLVNAAVYTGFGVTCFCLAFFILTKLTPFSIRKEIEEDQNIALAIIIGSAILGMALIVAAAVHG
jgi:putative membrane protein